MIVADEAALICDFAETYRLLDYREIPARKAAILACGLRPDSRIMQKIAGVKAPIDTLLRCIIADELKALVWQNTKDGAKGRNKPNSILTALLVTGEENQETGEGFNTAAEFDAWRNAMLTRGD
jgi:hypothetical protein